MDGNLANRTFKFDDIETFDRRWQMNINAEFLLHSMRNDINLHNICVGHEY